MLNQNKQTMAQAVNDLNIASQKADDAFNQLYVKELLHVFKTQKTVTPMMNALMIDNEELTKRKITVAVFRDFSVELIEQRKKSLNMESLNSWLLNSENGLVNMFADKCKKADCKRT
jgi:hypothetical protein